MNTVTSEDRDQHDARPLIACHECDLIQREGSVPPGGVLRCCRCRVVFYRCRGRGFDRALAFALAAFVL